MPDRIVRVGILTSDPVNELTWAAEVFYRRLMNVADDYGRFDGRASILRSTLYPLKVDLVSESDIGAWIRECAEAGLLRLYTVSGKPYLEVLKFGQRIRSDASKWPNPPDIGGQLPASASNGGQPPTNAPVVVSVDVVEDVSVSESAARAFTAVDLSIAMRAGGVQSQPADPRLIALAEQGVTPDTVAAACEEAKRSKPNEAVGLGYVAKILERWAKDAADLKAQGASAPQKQGAWWATDTSILAKGAELGMQPHLGEQMQQFKGRIQAAIDNGGKPPDPKPKPTVVIVEKETKNYKPEGIAPLKSFQKTREPA